MPNSPISSDNPYFGPKDPSNTETGMLAEFLGNNGETVAVIDNFTEFNLERDFFIAPDAFTLVLEDDRAGQLYEQLFMGMAIKFTISNVDFTALETHFPVFRSITFVGFIFNFQFDTDRIGHGQRLVIMGQDILGWMNKSVCLPNLGNAAVNTNFHFTPTTPVTDCLATLFTAFSENTAKSFIPPLQVVPQQDKSTIGSGGKQGVPIKGGRSLNPNLKRPINHLLSANMDETYLGYAERMAKHLGQNIKMRLSPQGNIVEIASPTYNLDGTEHQFEITHKTSFPNGNNNITGSLKIDLESQPSVIIVEQQTSGNNFYYQSLLKCLVVNEITGYPQVPNGKLQPATVGSSLLAAMGNAVAQDFGGKVYPIVLVSRAIDQLVSKYNYIPIKPNQELYDLIGSCGIRNVKTGIASPHYVMDTSAHTLEEVQFAAAKRMAEAQDKYLTLTYTMVGFNQGGFMWQTNAMCKVTDEVLGIDGLFWIKKVNFTQSKRDGSHTHVELSLPYTHLGLENIDQHAPTPPATPSQKPNYLHNLYVNGKVVTGFDDNGNPITQ